MDFIDFAKAFSSVNWHCLWRTLQAFGIPLRFTLLKYRRFFSNVTCCVGNSDIPFEVKDRVRQACVIIMSTVLFNLVDWIMRCTTEDKVKGIAKARMSDGFCYIGWDMDRNKLARKIKQIALTNIKK